MKRKYMILIILIIIVLGGIILMRIKKKDKPVNEISDITYFSMFYTKGYMINSDIRYTIEYIDGQYLVTIKPYSVSEEEGLKIIEPTGLRDSIKSLLIKYEVDKWDGFNKSDHDVLDGDSFSLSIRFNNDYKINASGYMSWPNNYRLFRDEIDELFMNIYNKEKGIEDNE